jgi:predicted dehydrogenase/threonine dehydrogenase-like Zn-dependent dehydrogenase
MKQIFQDVRTAEIAVEEVPAPKLLEGCILVRTAASLVSAGTERASSEFAGKNLFQKARMRPDLVREVLGKISRDGFAATLSAVRARLDQPSALGYSSAGTVIAIGEGVTGFRIGDRVACAGAGHAIHAEFACLPRLLVARIPSESVSFDDAAFTTLGSVALHGVRNAEAKLGDIVAVIGLGLLGQLTVQILKAAGCSVLGMDISRERSELALRSGADAVSTSSSEFHDLCLQFSSGHGADSVLITAQTESNDPVDLAGAVARSRASVVAVGTVSMTIPRRDFYQKELDFRVSRSYGPGRYDSVYEQKGIDYPIGYVRWTETRNMEAFLKLLADRKLNLQPLITHRFPIEQASLAYDLITGKSHQPSMGVLIGYPPIEYPQTAEHGAQRRIDLHCTNQPPLNHSSVRVGFIGAGSFALSTLLPAIKRTAGVDLVTASAANGSHARHAAAKFGFRSCTTDEQEVIGHPGVNTVVIATRHHLHAPQVMAALNARKHVFCEKPLCLTEAELIEISRAYGHRQNRRLLMVSFNRRFAPLVIRMKNFLRDVQEPLALHYRVNAGFLPSDHWLNNPEQGGGRIIAEVCHFVDLLSFLAGSAPVEVEARALANSGRYSNDNVQCFLRFSNGSHAAISYLANGDRSFSKERIEVFGGGTVAVLEDFRRLELVRGGKRQGFRSLLRQDKGHRAEWRAFVHAVQYGAGSPIPFGEIVTTMLSTFALEQSRCLGQAVAVKPLLQNDGINDDGKQKIGDGLDQAS